MDTQGSSQPPNNDQKAFEQQKNATSFKHKLFVEIVKTKLLSLKVAIVPVVILFLLGSIFLTLYQTQRQQNLRDKAAAGMADITLTTNRTNLLPGDEFMVTISMNTNGADVTGTELLLTYNTQAIQLIEYTNGEILPEMVTDFILLSGSAKVTLGSYIDPFNGSGILGVAKFRVLQYVPSPVSIELTGSKVTAFGNLDTNIAGTLTPTEITILGPTPSPGITQTRIEVVSPNSPTTTWEQGSTQQIQWRYLPDDVTTKNDVSTKIQLKRRTTQSNGIDVYTSVGTTQNTQSFDSTGGQINSFDFMVESNTPVGNNYRISVEAMPLTSSFGDNIPFTDRSDYDFSIIVAPSPTLSPTPTEAIILTPTEAISPTPTISQTVSPTLSPSTSPTYVPTSTSTPPVTTNTPFPTPTLAPGSTAVRLDVKLSSIGSMPNENDTPINPSRRVQIQVFNTQNEKIYETEGFVTFNGIIFTGVVGFEDVVEDGIYYFMIKLNNTLRKRIPGVVNLVSDTIVTLPQVKLFAADLNNDNIISITDWNIFLGCYGANICSQEAQSDFNDNGEVDGPDYNIFLQSLAVREGDGEVPETE